jgi:hypothetical protein
MNEFMMDIVLAGAFLAAGIFIGAFGMWSALSKHVDGQAHALSQEAIRHSGRRPVRELDDTDEMRPVPAED